MKKETMRSGTRSRPGKLAANQRGRRSQHKDNIIRETYESDVPRGGPVSAAQAGENSTAPDVGPEFKDSVEPPPPQLRRRRSKADPNRSGKSAERKTASR